MDGDRHELAREVVERGAVTRRQEACLGAGDVEADDAPLTVAHGEFGDLEAPVVVPHRRDELSDADAAPRSLHVVEPLLDARLHGLDRLVEAQAASEVLLGRPADLAVDDAVGAEVLHELARDPAEARTGLHDRGRQVERLEVLDERARVRLFGEPRPERLGIGRWNLEPELVGELDERLRTQAAVEVVVQRDLRQRLDVGAVALEPVLRRNRVHDSTIATRTPGSLGILEAMTQRVG